MDNLSPEARKKNMRNIRSKNTKPERIVMKELRKRKIYFAKHVDKIFGKPDIVFRRKKVAVFIDSDFWHCNPDKFVMPKTNTKYWEQKIDRNKKRDALVTETLEEKGWTVLRIWESDIKKDLEHVMQIILSSIDRCKSFTL